MAQKTEKSSSIPPLKRADGTWTTKAVDKAELFLEIFGGKYKPLQPQSNEHIDLGEAAHNSTAYFLVVRTKHAEAALKNLSEDSATGPDKLSAKVFKRCSKAFALPVAKLARAMLSSGRWLQLW